MNAIDYIEKIEKNKFYIQKKQRKIEELENCVKNLSSRSLENERVKSSGNKDRIGTLTVRIVEEKEKLMRFILDNEDLTDYVTDQIDNMENLTFSKIMYYRHIERMGYDEIADILDLSPRTIRNQHTKAMRIFEKTFVAPYNDKK